MADSSDSNWTVMVNILEPSSVMTVLSVLQNIRKHPQNNKFRTLYKTNKRCRREIFDAVGAVPLLRAIGFTPQDDSVSVLSLEGSDLDMETIDNVIAQLKLFQKGSPQHAAPRSLERQETKSSLDRDLARIRNETAALNPWQEGATETAALARESRVIVDSHTVDAQTPVTYVNPFADSNCDPRYVDGSLPVYNHYVLHDRPEDTRPTCLTTRAEKQAERQMLLDRMGGQRDNRVRKLPVYCSTHPPEVTRVFGWCGSTLIFNLKHWILNM